MFDLNCLWNLKLDLHSIKVLTFNIILGWIWWCFTKINIYNNICNDLFVNFKINKPINK